MKFEEKLVTPKFYSNLTQSQFNSLVKDENAFYHVIGMGVYKGTTLIATMDSTQGWIKNNEIITSVLSIPSADLSSPDLIQYENNLYRKQIKEGQSVGKYIKVITNEDKYATNINFILDQTNYKITVQLTDQDGNNLGTERTIDLPLESVVVNGKYDEKTKEIVLTLQNGNVIRFSVADLVDGLQPTLISGTNIKTINGQDLLGSGNIEISGLDRDKLIEQVTILPEATETSADFVGLINGSNTTLYRKKKYIENNVTKYAYEKILTEEDKADIDDVLATKVGLTGDEIIQGVKTFETKPQVKNGDTTENLLSASDIVVNDGEETTETMNTLKVNGVNYKASNVVANPTTTATTPLNSIQIDGVTYSVTVDEDAKKLLWTNPNYDQEFIGTDNPIALDLAEYDLVIVVINNNTSATTQVSHIYNRDNLIYRADASYEGNFVYRNVQVSNAAVTFGNGNKFSSYNGTVVEDNTVAIPYQIYGIRLKLSTSGGGSGGGSTVIANPTGIATTDLKKVSVDGIIYGIRGTEVKANPDNAVVTLNSIEIDGAKYKIESAASIPIRRL